MFFSAVSCYEFKNWQNGDDLTEKRLVHRRVGRAIAKPTESQARNDIIKNNH